jgi:hypothetical protein
MGLLRWAFALGLGFVIWRVSVSTIRMLATPPPPVDPHDVVPVRQDYKCSVCGTEVTMTVQNVREALAPKHCREEMVEVWRP